MKRPPHINTTQQRLASYAYLLTPLSKCLLLTVPFKEYAVASVVALSSASSPSAINEFIVAVYVNAIDRMKVARTASHIDQEVGEGIKPSFADDNSTSSVSLVCGVIWVIATASHVTPRRIFHAVAIAVSGIFVYRYSDSFASAGRCFSVAKICRSGQAPSSAITPTVPTKPMSMSRLFNRWMVYHQAAKALACQVNPFSSHRVDFMLLGAN